MDNPLKVLKNLSTTPPTADLAHHEEDADARRPRMHGLLGGKRSPSTLPIRTVRVNILRVNARCPLRWWALFDHRAAENGG
jgi:hypothetical protein